MSDYSPCPTRKGRRPLLPIPRPRKKTEGQRGETPDRDRTWRYYSWQPFDMQSNSQRHPAVNWTEKEQDLALPRRPFIAPTNPTACFPPSQAYLTTKHASTECGARPACAPLAGATKGRSSDALGTLFVWLAAAALAVCGEKEQCGNVESGVLSPGLMEDHDSLQASHGAKTAVTDQASYPVLSKELVLRG